MNHSFIPSQLNKETCSNCHREEIDHTDRATCEVCGSSGTMNEYDKILMCLDCELLQRPAHTVAEMDRKALITRERFAKIDSGLKIQTDIFNAKTIAINALKLSIDDDSTIPVDQKHFALAKAIDERYQHLKNLIHGKREEITDHENEQRALQTYYNEHAKRLRQEEREKIRLKDAQYKPIKPEIKKPRAVKPKKFDRDAIRDASRESGIPEAVLQMLCIARNMTPLEAVRHFKEVQSM
jgi:RNA polymerase subunit RPABC4/transcription elongation factor Spt4